MLLGPSVHIVRDAGVEAPVTVLELVHEERARLLRRLLGRAARKRERLDELRADALLLRRRLLRLRLLRLRLLRLISSRLLQNIFLGLQLKQHY